MQNWELLLARSKLTAPFGNWSNRSLLYLGRTVELYNIYLYIYIYIYAYIYIRIYIYIHIYMYVLIFAYNIMWIYTNYIYKRYVCIYIYSYDFICTVIFELILLWIVFLWSTRSHVSLTSWDDFWEHIATGMLWPVHQLRCHGWIMMFFFWEDNGLRSLNLWLFGKPTLFQKDSVFYP